MADAAGRLAASSPASPCRRKWPRPGRHQGLTGLRQLAESGRIILPIISYPHVSRGCDADAHHHLHTSTNVAKGGRNSVAGLYARRTVFGAEAGQLHAPADALVRFAIQILSLPSMETAHGPVM